MAKKKNKEEVMTFSPKVGLKLDTNVLINNPPSYKIEDIPPPQLNKFIELKSEIHNLGVGKCISVYTTGTNLNVYQLQVKISGIAFSHKKKIMDKDFTTSIIDDKTVRCWRTK